jgi:hypothetical protein
MNSFWKGFDMLFVNIDEYLLARCARFSHWFQRLTGRTNFFIAKVGTMITGMSVLVSLINYWIPLSKLPTSFFHWVPSLFLLWVMAKESKNCAENEKRLYSDRALRQMMPKNSVWIRMAALYFTILLGVFMVRYHSFFEILRYSTGIGVSVFFYFIAVTPLPPGHNKIGEFVKKLASRFRKPVPVSVST